MPGKAPTLKREVKAMLARKEAMSLVGQGLPITEISARMNMPVRSVRRVLHRALETESLFPNTLTPERVAELRILEGEKLNRVWSLVSKALDVVDPHDAHKVARLAEATARLSEQQCKIWGLYQPTRIVEESLRLQVTKSEHKVLVTFDKAQIAPNWSIDTGFRRVPPDEDLSVEPPRLLEGTNGN
jgi:hypothetical protein